MKDSSKGKPESKRLNYGSIVVDPEKHHGKPYLRDTNIEVDTIINLFRAGVSDKEICDIFNKKARNDNAPPLTKKKIDSCRAWFAYHYPEELKGTFNRVSKANMVMLDENMSYRMLPKIVQLFGRSSHVVFDQLIGERNDDEKDIWKFVEDNDFKLVITGDTDFKGISERYRKKKKIETGEPVSPGMLPTVIFIPSTLRNSYEQTERYLIKYQEDIRQFMEDRDAVYATLTKDGLKKTGVVKKTSDRESSNDNRQNPPKNPGRGASPG